MRWLETKTEPRLRMRGKCRLGVISLIPLFFSLSGILGCAAVVPPMKPGTGSSLEVDEGLVLGRIQLRGSGGELLTAPEQPFRTPFHLQWRLKEQVRGKEFLIYPLPNNGPFVLKLPVGSYQLTALSFDTALGIWQASLPTSFNVSSRGCTYLGTWELRTQAGFFDGFIVRHVFDQHSLAERDLQTFMTDELENPMVTQLSTSAESPLILTFRTQGTELTSPP